MPFGTQVYWRNGEFAAGGRSEGGRSPAAARGSLLSLARRTSFSFLLDTTNSDE